MRDASRNEPDGRTVGHASTEYVRCRLARFNFNERSHMRIRAEHIRAATMLASTAGLAALAIIERRQA